MNKKTIYIDPSYPDYYQDRLFSTSENGLNRDGTLLPLVRLKEYLENNGLGVKTADYLIDENFELRGHAEYFSLGCISNIEKLIAKENLKLSGFIIMEPPIVSPHLYKALPEITKYFERVYLHNTVGDGYSLNDVNQSKLRKFFWPQPYWGVLEKFWDNSNRLNRIVVINGNHRPKRSGGELYSERIFAMSALADLGVVDLYGRGWNRWWSRSSLWLPYWLNRRRLMSIYKGACRSKYEVLSRYKFCLCFENMQMSGYVTEKLFDCLFAGAIPLYLGAPDIDLLIPSDAFIDCRKFSSWQEMWAEINKIPEGELQKMRDAGREFLNSKSYLPYYNSLEEIVDLNVA